MFTPIGILASSDSTAAQAPPGEGPGETTAIEPGSHYWNVDETGSDYQDSGDNSGDTGIWYFEREGDEINPNVSLRLDETGNAFAHTVTGGSKTNALSPIVVNSGNSTTPRMPADLSGDFTVEIALRQVGFGSEHGLTVHMVGVFILGFDRYDGGATITPTFQLLNPKGSDTAVSGPGYITQQSDTIQSTTDYNNLVIKDARGSTTALVDNTYHLLGTFEASSKTMKLYVDGVLADTQTLTTGEYNSFLLGDDADAQKDLSDGTRYKRDRIYVMPNRSIAGDGSANELAYTNGGYSDDLRIHQGTYMSDNQAAAQASLYRLGSSLV